MIKQTTTLELPNGRGIPLYVCLADDPPAAPEDTASTATTARRYRYATVTVVGEVDLDLATVDAIPVAVSVNDLETLHHCLAVMARRWNEAADDAEAAAQVPRGLRAPSPGHINIEPTPGGYRAAARLFRAERTRAEQLGHRISRLLDLAHTAGVDGGCA